MTDPVALHAKLLVRCDPAWYGLRDDPPAAFGALRAVVELHRPRQLPTAPDGYCVCDACDIGPPPARHVPWADCKTIKAITGELGVSTP